MNNSFSRFTQSGGDIECSDSSKTKDKMLKHLFFSCLKISEAPGISFDYIKTLTIGQVKELSE